MGNCKGEISLEELKDEKIVQDANVFTHRMEETWFTKAVKYVVNFLIATLQVILNVYLLAFALITAIIEGLQWAGVDVGSWDLLSLTDNTLWVIVIIIICTQLTLLTRKNIRSKSINLIWAVNFVGRIRNLFFSKQLARDHVKTTDEYINEVAQELVEDTVKEYKIANEKLQNNLERLLYTASFPMAFFDSIIRIHELFTLSITDKDNPKYAFENILDKFLAELVTFIPGANQGSIFIYDGNKFRAYGNFNIKESSLKKKYYDLSEGFSGIVALESSAIWIFDLEDASPSELSDLGFEPDPDRAYKAIYGYPILDHYKNGIGVINIHFTQPVEFTDNELENIEKLTEVISSYIYSLIKLKQYPVVIFDDIMK